MEFQYTELGNDVFAYQAREGNEKVGEITWTLLGDIMVMDHTFVSPTLRGGGVAKQLLDQAADYAAVLVTLRYLSRAVGRKCWV